MKFSIEEDKSEIFEEAYKANVTKGKLKAVGEVESTNDEIKIKLKPKCSK